MDNATYQTERISKLIRTQVWTATYKQGMAELKRLVESRLQMEKEFFREGKLAAKFDKQG